MSNIRANGINYRLWFLLFFFHFIPQIYSVMRIHLLGVLPDPSALNIASQVEWLNVGYEVLSEGVIIPLTFLLGQVINDSELFRKRVSVAFMMIILIYSTVTIFVIMLAPDIIRFMSQRPEYICITTHYIRLESVAIFVSCCYTFLNSILILKNKQKLSYILLISQTIMTIIADMILVSEFHFSLKLGVYGVAISNIIVNMVMTIISFNLLKRAGMEVEFSQMRISGLIWVKQWFRIGWKSGVESLLKNAVYIIMILKMMNMVQESSTFWLANKFIWGWLLLPVIALGQLIKQDAASKGGVSQRRVISYLKLTAGIAAVWIFTMPLWTMTVRLVTNHESVNAVVEFIQHVIFYYIFFALSCVMDGYFYGTGRTDLILIKSLVVNVIYYGAYFSLYHAGLFLPDFESITIMLGGGMILNTLITVLLYWVIRRRSRN